MGNLASLVHARSVDDSYTRQWSWMAVDLHVWDHVRAHNSQCFHGDSVTQDHDACATPLVLGAGKRLVVIRNKTWRLDQLEAVTPPQDCVLTAVRVADWSTLVDSPSRTNEIRHYPMGILLTYNDVSILSSEPEVMLGPRSLNADLDVGRDDPDAWIVSGTCG